MGGPRAAWPVRAEVYVKPEAERQLLFDHIRHTQDFRMKMVFHNVDSMHYHTLLG